MNKNGIAFGLGDTLVERIFSYSMGYVASDISTYPIPVLLWTFVFGITILFAYLLLIFYH